MARPTSALPSSPSKKKGGQIERLCLVFSRERDRSNTDKSWEDREESQLENQLTEILVQMLLSAEASYRNGLARHREWIIERKAEAEAEIKWRLDEAERKARELQLKSERQRIGRLLSQAKAFDRANQIRTYVESARLRVAETAKRDSFFMVGPKESTRSTKRSTRFFAKSIND
ncbi:hypothetical protein [Bradyrhizobium japonicum]|uniref:hypothetical protein n=1 Tax=Bradyrhizobium japonicum TaxID=375 RepID=UPI0012BC5C0F|nr:hypothetical protein [Bradyrhizobium japonicum]WLB87856.1 hypothetical protein QIH91_35030 [Bradyrhizobium japonicum USDA 135]